MNIPDYMKVTPSKPDHATFPEADWINSINISFSMLMRQGWRDDEPPTDGTVFMALFKPAEGDSWEPRRTRSDVGKWYDIEGKWLEPCRPYMWRPLTDEEAKT